MKLSESYVFTKISASRLTGTIVSVCGESQIDCAVCGLTPSVGQGKWATVECPEDTVGSVVTMVTPRNYFQACEIEVYGEHVEKSKLVI